MNLTSRKSVEEMFEIVKKFDVISFDIFDTALLRKVEFPSDIFDIMALEMHWPDFTSARKRAEDYARVQKEKAEGHREVTIDEIYSVLRERYNIEMIWMQREIELEKQSKVPYRIPIYLHYMNVLFMSAKPWCSPQICIYPKTP